MIKSAIILFVGLLFVSCNNDDEGTTIVSCEDPSNLQLLQVKDIEALIQWNFGENYSSADIEYGLAGFTLGNGRVVKSLNGQFRFLDLTQDTQYDAYVTANCGENAQSGTVGPITFKTLLPCDAPEFLDLTNPSEGTVIAQWGPFVEGIQWELEYGVTGFELGDGTVMVVTQPSAIIQSLEPNSYSFYVKSLCGEDFESEYFGPMSISLE